MPTDSLFSPECPLHSSAQSSGYTRSDVRLIENATLDLLHQPSLMNFLKLKEKEAPLFADYTPVQQMHLLQLSQNGVPTLAALLFFCPYPQGLFPQLSITVSVIPGRTLCDGAPCFTEDRRIEGSLLQMYFETCAFCRHIGIYPAEAMQELIMNALIHRDYGPGSDGRPIRILFFDDRVEVHSPGALYGCPSVQELTRSCPDLRNPTIASMAEVLSFAHGRYSGIAHVKALLSEASFPPPVFESTEDEFIAVLYRGGEAKEKTEGLLDFCGSPRSRQEIADYLGVKTVFYAVQHYIAPLLESGKLAMTIPDKPKSSRQRFFSTERN